MKTSDNGIEVQGTNDSPATTVETKVCRFCGRELPIEQFSPSSRHKDGHMPICKECRSLQAREYYEKNREKILTQQREHRSATKDDKAADEAKPAISTSAGATGVGGHTLTKVRKTLDDYEPRELFEQLKRLGYKWAYHGCWHEKVTVEKNYVEYDKIGC